MIPSRQSNPFATCWTKPGAIAYRFLPGESATRLVHQLAQQNWWGQIVGTHGSGKSTLLATLLPSLQAAGRDVRTITLHDGQKRLPRGFLASALSSSQTLLVVDGYEQLAPWWRMWLRRSCRRAGAGLLVTSHADTGLPMLARLAPDLRLVEQLVEDLSKRIATPVIRADVVASHACHGSNVREILFDLYDRHEQRQRAARTAAACGT